MTTEQSKFILAAYRPNGADAADPAFADAVSHAAGDPALGAWFLQSRAVDAAVAGKLRQVQPPPGLRGDILAGVAASGARRSNGLGWGWIGAMAAAAALLVGGLSLREPGRSDTAASALATFAISDMVNERHVGAGEPAAALVAQLQTAGTRMPAADRIDFEKLRETGCRTLNFAGHDLLEVCFARDGAMFHFYVTRRDGPVGDAVARGPSFVTEPGGSAAVWSDGKFDYALASTAGIEAIRRLL